MSEYKCVKKKKRACNIKIKIPAPPEDQTNLCAIYNVNNYKNESILSKQEKLILFHGLHVAYKKCEVRF